MNCALVILKIQRLQRVRTLITLWSPEVKHKLKFGGLYLLWLLTHTLLDRIL